MQSTTYNRFLKHIFAKDFISNLFGIYIAVLWTVAVKFTRYALPPPSTVVHLILFISTLILGTL